MSFLAPSSQIRSIYTPSFLLEARLHIHTKPPEAEESRFLIHTKQQINVKSILRVYNIFGSRRER